MGIEDGLSVSMASRDVSNCWRAVRGAVSSSSASVSISSSLCRASFSGSE